jgi:NADP-dependent 3-hydroxy acid dehydrogenase YdfG
MTASYAAAFAESAATAPRVAVVTGASSGIGAASARALAAAGFLVVCAARRTERIEALAEEIGGRAVTCDVTVEADVAALAEAAGGSIEVLVNNAGGALGTESVEGAVVEKWRQMYEMNVIGTLQVTKALLPALEASGVGIVINVGSIAGHLSYEGGVHRGQARPRCPDRDAAPRALEPPDPGHRDRAGHGADRGLLPRALRRRPGEGGQGL